LNPFRLISVAAVGGLLLSVASVSLAGETAEDLSQVIVTAQRAEEKLEDSIAAVTLYTREQTRGLQVRSIEELLRAAPGMAVVNSGGPGKLTSFFVRGTESDHLLVLVDGVRIGSATTGAAALQNLPLEQVERIEYVRGPRSGLYGPDAVGGVLQLFTRKGEGFSASLSGGSFDTRQADASWGFGGERAWLNLSGSLQSTDGTNACTGSSSEFAGCFTEEPDKDAYEYGSFALRGGVKLGSATTLEASYWQTDGEVDFDSSWTNHSDVLQRIASATLRQGLGERLALQITAGRAWDESDDFQGGNYMESFDTTRDSASAQLEFTPQGPHSFAFGIDYLDDKVGGTTEYEETSRDNLGLYTRYTGTLAGLGLAALRLEASLRYDDNSQFGDATTGSAGVAWSFSPGFELLAQYGTAFKAPTFNELYYPFFGNPLLEPEHSQSMELGAQGAAAGLHWRATVFETRIRDLVGFDANFMPANIDRTKIRGLEASGNYAVGGWLLDASLTLLDPRNESEGPNEDNLLPRRPRTSGYLDVERRWSSLAFGARVTAEDARWDDAANTRRVDGYATVDLRAEWEFAESWSVQLRVANVLDEDYETVSYFPQPGRAWYLALRLH